MEAFTETHNGYNNNTFIEKLENYCHFLVISLRFRINCHNTETKMFVLVLKRIVSLRQLVLEPKTQVLT